jgi:hypothetical protein
MAENQRLRKARANRRYYLLHQAALQEVARNRYKAARSRRQRTEKNG